MQLYSKVPISSPASKINHQSKILSIGSCFAAEIGQRLLDNEFQVCVNPFGTQFHPLAIEQVFNRIYMREHYADSEIFHYNGLYFSWDHSTHFSDTKKDKVLATINNEIDEANLFLSESKVFIFTLGTAWAYQLNQEEIWVSNCHKVPQKHFNKILLSPTQVYESLKRLVLNVWDVKPEAQIVFTISPVRHIKDGFRENNISKGVLHYALDQLLTDFSAIHYFPSYEIALDELRDYRYYAEDLAHLNHLGIQYIWEKFSESYFNEETSKLNLAIEKIKKSVAHKPWHPTSVNHKKFLYETLKKAQELALKLHKDALNKEINTLKKQIHAY